MSVTTSGDFSDGGTLKIIKGALPLISPAQRTALILGKLVILVLSEFDLSVQCTGRITTAPVLLIVDGATVRAGVLSTRSRTIVRRTRDRGTPTHFGLFPLSTATAAGVLMKFRHTVPQLQVVPSTRVGSRG